MTNMVHSAPRRILVFGANGQVGHELPARLSELGHVTALDRTSADLSAPDTLRAVVRHHRPDIIVNAAAYTAVDRAEREPELAFAVNAVAPAVLAEEAEASGACLVHYSSDYVFDGAKSGSYVETDATGPLSVYGRSKLLGELNMALACRRHVIFRTSWVFGVHGSNFLKTILRLAAERESLRVVADQFGAPTSARMVASLTGRFLERELMSRDSDAAWGVYHLAPAGEASWYSYARHIIECGRELGLPLLATADSVEPISTMEYPVAALRPSNSRLDTSRLRVRLGMELPDWRRSVTQTIQELHSSGPR
jgi:dTDP-4-dehydrorhamnose reductase